MVENPSPIFLKTYELLVWLLQHTKKYPKEQRFVMAKRMQEAMLDFQDCLLLAGKASDPKYIQRMLHEADGHLARLRVYARLGYDLKLSSSGQYEFLNLGLDEVGRLLGGWIKKNAEQVPPPRTRKARANA